MIEALEVRLHDRRIGTLTNLSGDDNLFSFEQSYLEDEFRPTLSQAFIGPSGTPIARIPRTHRVAPPFFANLLPEDSTVLRSIVARQNGINETRDYPYLRVLGADLPGAVSTRPIEGFPTNETAVETTLPADERRLRFSLAGFQAKISANSKRARITIPLEGEGGSWIAKFPSNAFPRLPENESTVMGLARTIGLPVPATMLVELDSIDGVPAEFLELRDDEPRLAYAIERFDRHVDGTRTHVEDFNQIANQRPEQRYENKTSSWIASVIATLAPADVDDFVRRLVFGICVGNNDMHLKNWSVTYPDERNARLAPMYDYVCTRRYFSAGTLALTVGGEREFERIGIEALRRFAALAEISARRTAVVARETVAAIRDAWPRFRETFDDPALERTLDRCFQTVPLMNGR